MQFKALAVILAGFTLAACEPASEVPAPQSSDSAVEEAARAAHPRTRSAYLHRASPRARRLALLRSRRRIRAMKSSTSSAIKRARADLQRDREAR